MGDEHAITFDCVYCGATGNVGRLVMRLTPRDTRVSADEVIDELRVATRKVSGVNVTLGLSRVRTSVDHGTAYDIAGKGIANPIAAIWAGAMMLEMLFAFDGYDRPWPKLTSSRSGLTNCLRCTPTNKPPTR